MYNYLLRKYPIVNRSLYAGELTLGMVRPKDLTFHIEEAIDIAKMALDYKSIKNKEQ